MFNEIRRRISKTRIAPHYNNGDTAGNEYWNKVKAILCKQIEGTLWL